jgi:hypothetical protein
MRKKRGSPSEIFWANLFLSVSPIEGQACAKQRAIDFVLKPRPLQSVQADSLSVPRMWSSDIIFPNVRDHQQPLASGATSCDSRNRDRSPEGTAVWWIALFGFYSLIGIMSTSSFLRTNVFTKFS